MPILNIAFKPVNEARGQMLSDHQATTHLDNATSLQRRKSSHTKLAISNMTNGLEASCWNSLKLSSCLLLLPV